MARSRQIIVADIKAAHKRRAEYMLRIGSLLAEVATVRLNYAAQGTRLDALLEELAALKTDPNREAIANDLARLQKAPPPAGQEPRHTSGRPRPPSHL